MRLTTTWQHNKDSSTRGSPIRVPWSLQQASAISVHQSLTLDTGLQVLAVGLAAFYGGMLDLLRVFYVLTACLIPLDLYQMIWGSLSALQVFLVILAMVARGAACWFGYQVHAEHNADASQGGAQYRDPDAFIPQDGEGV
jgi:hypothetical protein